MPSSDSPAIAPEVAPLTRLQQHHVLWMAFLAWMFAGLELQLFILIHLQMMDGLLGSGFEDKLATLWFARFQAAFLFGAAAGGWLFGSLGDSIGRTRSMGLSVLCYSGFTLACYFVDSVPAMIVLRFLACLGIGGVWPNAVALVAEAWPSASRPFLAGLLGAAANVGAVLLGVIGYSWHITNDDWRWTLLIGATPFLLGIWVLIAVPESRKWLAARQATTTAARSSSVGEVLRPPLLSTLLLGIGLGAVPVVGTAANASWVNPWTSKVAEATSGGAAKKSPPNPTSKALTMINRSGGGILGSLLGGIIASLFGRRLTYFLISLGTLALSSWIYGWIDPLHPHFQWYVFAYGFIGVAYFGWLPLFLPEMFPTRVRSTGAGISFNTGRIIAGIVVLTTSSIVAAAGGDYAAIGFWSGMIYVVGMLIIWLVPRKAPVLAD
ncbi:MAG: MFS transporter [Planctomycetaceae bacterium]|nr:MFS transporter [Planctomycetaceae bacterium]